MDVAKLELKLSVDDGDGGSSGATSHNPLLFTSNCWRGTDGTSNDSPALRSSVSVSLGTISLASLELILSCGFFADGFGGGAAVGSDFIVKEGRTGGSSRKKHKKMAYRQRSLNLIMIGARIRDADNCTSP
jgi:hypothetical protein